MAARPPERRHLIARFFAWLEGTTDPFPPERPERPAGRFFAFMWHYSKPFAPLLAASFLLSTAVAVLEVYVFGFLGTLVDLMSKADRASFWQDNETKLVIFGALTLIGLPLLNFLAEAVENQGLRGPFAMRIRWLAHRYL